MTDKLEMPLEQFAEAVAKENVRLNNHIEKLEAALREMLTKCTWENNGRWCGSIDCHCRIARKALEGKDD